MMLISKRDPEIKYITQRSPVTHVCVCKKPPLIQLMSRLIGAKPLSQNNAGILSIGPFRTNFRKMLVFSLKELHLKMSSAKWRPFFWAKICQCFHEIIWDERILWSLISLLIVRMPKTMTDILRTTVIDRFSGMKIFNHFDCSLWCSDCSWRSNWQISHYIYAYMRDKIAKNGIAKFNMANR